MLSTVKELVGVYSQLQSGYDLSRQEIQKAKKEKRYDFLEGLGYGEVDMDAFIGFLKSLPLIRKDVFVDMGSGSGKAVLAAAFSEIFTQCIGIEILKPLHLLALEAQEKASDLDDEKATRASFLLGDIFDHEEIWRKADVMLVTCTLFSDFMMNKLDEFIQRVVRQGTFVITTTRRLSNPRARLVSENRIKYAKGSLLFIVYYID